MRDWPNIYRACLEVALDNGGVNRFRTREAQEVEFEQWIARQPHEPLPKPAPHLPRRHTP